MWVPLCDNWNQTPETRARNCHQAKVRLMTRTGLGSWDKNKTDETPEVDEGGGRHKMKTYCFGEITDLVISFFKRS